MSTRSLACTAAAGSAAMLAPADASGAARPGVRFHAVTGCPAASSALASADCPVMLQG